MRLWLDVLQAEPKMGDVPSEEIVRRNVLELMRWRRMNQVTLAERLGKSQPWLSRRLSTTDKSTRFQFGDLDAIADVFGVSPAQLMCAGIGEWERRKGERRSGEDRRRMQQVRFGTEPERRQHAADRRQNDG